ncbi:MAG: gliding motility lipoprotein GldD [Weeksellaceae bacterium]|nr:gliding motility lipoprotein GldD [Weeksellaceae bacterium]
MIQRLLLAGILIILTACDQDYIPKPYGQVRLSYPTAEYRDFVTNCPFTFQYSQQAVKQPKDSSCNYNLYYPDMRATIYLSYEPVDQDLTKLLMDAERAVYEPHTSRAEYIEPKLIVRPNARVYGTLYSLGGNSAMNFQFHLTDSTKHFVRGSVYFKAHPKPDSLAPAVQYIQQDVEKLMETIRWQ